MAEKSTPSQEFLESWNECMGDSQIAETDLRKPTEKLFINWLKDILDQLHVDTSCYDSMNVETGSRLRCLRFKLISTVNYFLAIPQCQKKMSLNYFNLTSPTFKIVFTTLRYLLNYSFFVKMIYSKNIIESAKRVAERDNLRTTKNQLRKEIEEAKIEGDNCVKMYRDYEKRIPQQKCTIATLQEKEERLVKEIQKVEQEIEQTDMLLLELKSQKTSLSENIVCDQEAEAIYASKESVQRQLHEQEDYIIAGRQKLKENSATVERIRSLTNKMEALHSEFSIDTSDIKHLKSNFVKQQLSLSNLKNNIEQLQSAIDYLTQNIRIKNENIAKLNSKKEEIEATIGSKDKANLQVLKQQVIKLHEISVKEDKMLYEKQRIKDELDLLYTISTNVIKQMSL